MIIDNVLDAKQNAFVRKEYLGSTNQTWWYLRNLSTGKNCSRNTVWMVWKTEAFLHIIENNNPCFSTYLRKQQYLLVFLNCALVSSFLILVQ